MHDTVNHSYEFINSETGDHTQNIESTWWRVKRFLPRGGTNHQMYKSYFAEFHFCHKYLQDSNDMYIAFLDKVKSVYCPSLHL